MTSTIAGTADGSPVTADTAGGPSGTCRRPGCGRPLPARQRGRARVYCCDDCARHHHNGMRVPAAPAAGDPDPLAALDALTRQAAALVKVAREQAAALDPARVRAQLAQAEAARRRAEAAAGTAQAQAAEALEQACAMAEALDAERTAARTAEAAAQAAHDQAAHDRQQAQTQISALQQEHATQLAEAREHAAGRERDQALAGARDAAQAAATETSRARQAEADARAETARVRADAARERDALRDACQAALDAERALTSAQRARAEHAERLLEAERADRRQLTTHLTSSTGNADITPDSAAEPGPVPAPARHNGKTPGQRQTRRNP